MNEKIIVKINKEVARNQVILIKCEEISNECFDTNCEKEKWSIYWVNNEYLVKESSVIFSINNVTDIVNGTIETDPANFAVILFKDLIGIDIDEISLSEYLNLSKSISKILNLNEAYQGYRMSVHISYNINIFSGIDEWISSEKENQRELRFGNHEHINIKAGTLAKKVLLRAKPDMNIEELDKDIIDIFVKMNTKPIYFNVIDPYITSYRLEYDYVSSPESPKSTFDFIKIAMSVKQSANKEWMMKHYKIIARYMLAELANTKKFARYNVPINILKLENCTLTKDGRVIFTFGIKNII